MFGLTAGILMNNELGWFLTASVNKNHLDSPEPLYRFHTYYHLWTESVEETVFSALNALAIYSSPSATGNYIYESKHVGLQFLSNKH